MRCWPGNGPKEPRKKHENLKSWYPVFRHIFEARNFRLLSMKSTDIFFSKFCVTSLNISHNPYMDRHRYFKCCTEIAFSDTQLVLCTIHIPSVFPQPYSLTWGVECKPYGKAINMFTRNSLEALMLELRTYSSFIVKNCTATCGTSWQIQG
jgi:hypothetical protein